MLLGSIEVAQSGGQDVDATAWLTWLIPVLLIVGVVNLLGALKRRRRLGAFAGGVTPVRDLGEAEGTTVIAGTVVTNDPLTSPITRTPCAYFAYSVEEEWRKESTKRKTVHEPEIRHGAEGWETSHFERREVVSQNSKSGTKVIAQASRSTPFQVRDATGEVLVVPERAEIVGVTNFEGVVDRSSPIYEIPGVREQRHSTGHRLIKEDVLQVGAAVTVVGPVMREGGTARIQWSSRRRPSSGRRFLVTVQEASQAAQSENRGMISRFVIAGACLVGIVVIFAVAAQPADAAVLTSLR